MTQIRDDFEKAFIRQALAEFKHGNNQQLHKDWAIFGAKWMADYLKRPDISKELS